MQIPTDATRQPRPRMQDLLSAGASGADPISQNGVHIASIQALTRQLEVAKARLAQLQRAGGSVDDAAHDAATSPRNDTPEPTDAQKRAGNYSKGHIRIGGLDISIENPQGSERRGVDRSGKAWKNTLQDHYGYIRGTVGNDKDHVDVFVKAGTPSDFRGTAFVVDQVDPSTGKFDEHKALIGYGSEQEARAAYARNYAADWKGLKAITPLAWVDFVAWVKHGPTTRPLAKPPARQPRPRMGAGAPA